MEEEIAKGYDKLTEIENYKQINEDLESGKTFLVDYNDNNKECNQFGIPLIKCYPNVTGQKSYKYRLNKKLIDELQYDTPQYLPNTSHLVGSSMYPRPLSIPFNQIEKSEKLMDMIKKEEIFNYLRNKDIFDLEKEIKENKSLPSYFCVKLGADSPKTRKYLINLFQDYIKNKKKEYNNEPKYYLKDSSIKGLTEYQSFLKNNLTKNLFNGNKIPYTKQKDINNKFKIVKRLVKKEGWNKMHLERQNINYETYTKLYQIKRVGDNNNIFKKNLSSINFNENKQKEENENDIILEKNIYKKKNTDSYPIKIKFEKNEKLIAALTPREKENKNKFHNFRKKSRQKILYDSNILNNQSKKHFNYSSFQSNYNKSMNKFGSTVTTCFNYNNESRITKNIFPIKKDLYTPKNFHHFQRSLSNFNSPKNHLERNNDEEKNNKIDDQNENIEDYEVSEISDSQEINKKRIKKLNEIKKDCEHENKLIKGYQPPPENEEFQENIKRKAPSFISPISIYKKEIELFKKVNPIEYERELKKKIFDDKMLLKKLRNRKIYEKIKIKK